MSIADTRPGRALVKADPEGLSFSAKIVRMFGLSRRPPVRLLAVPRDPVPGDKAFGAGLLEGWFDAEPIDGLDPGALAPEQWEHLQGFGWLRDLAAAGTAERGRAAAEALARAWLAGLPDRAEGPQWRADLWGRRLLLAPAYAPWLLATRDLEYRTRLLKALVAGAQHIEKSGDKCRAGLPRITAWSGAVAAALLIQGAPTRIEKAEGGLGRAIRSGLGDDGGLLSRSPTEQLELVETLPLLRAAYATGTRGAPDWLEEAQEGALAALLSVQSGDGALTSWQGGNPLDGRRIAAAIAAASLGDRPAALARTWGYQRLQAKESVLVIDAAPPPPASARNGASASTLAFELSDGAQRLVVNCGGAGQRPDALGTELTHLLRSTAAHSTLTLGDYNSTSILEDGRLGRGVAEVTMERGTRDGRLAVEASHDGYVRRFGLLHRRQLYLSPDGKTLEGVDALILKGKARKAGVPFVLRFHLAPEVEVTRTADGRGALLRTGPKQVWQFKVRGGIADVEDSLWIDGTGTPRATLQLAVSGESPPDGMSISWELKRAG
jgi:uncharacterized heparinase superfamily protein